MNLLSDTKISWLQKDTLISGMNYDETFVHVAKITIICTLIALALVHMILDMFASSRKHYTISNKHFVLGLRNFLL
jgi:hypothetical protein